MAERAAVRCVRVFLSSSFLDMQEEREALIRRVFPELRERCEARGVNWGEVDLRWGVTREEAEERLALPICLAEIDECRPFFLAMLGERYGWVPDAIASDAVARYPWLDNMRGRSVTELEIRHGALNDRSDAALFYFRDPAWLDRLSDTADRANYETTEPQARRRLAELKEEIIAAGFRVRTYSDPKELGPLVREDMIRLLDRFLPSAAASLDERDAAAQGALIARHSSAHVGNRAELRLLDEHAQGTKSPAGLIVTGEAGSGKSALLARWVALRGDGGLGPAGSVPGMWQRFLGRGNTRQKVVVFHFAGASVDSTGVPAMLRWLTAELGRRAGFQWVIADNPVGRSTAFATALAAAAVKRQVVLVLDGLDQIDRRGQGLDLAWLPHPLPKGVRVIASASPGPVLDELSSRRWRSMTLGPIDRPARAEFVKAYLRSNHHKTLDRDQAAQVAAVEAGANPLFLRTLLEELVCSARLIEDLTELIGRYAGAKSQSDLFDLMLTRLENAHEKDRPGLLAKALTLLWASRHGLSDGEAEDLLGDPKDGPLPPAVWVPLRHAVRPFTASWSGLVNLPEGALRQAAERRYLSHPAAQASAHRRLAEYFVNRSMSVRVVEELPSQLAALGDWEALADMITCPNFLETGWPRHRYEIAAYWQAAEARAPARVAGAMARLAEAPSPAALAVAQLLAGLGRRALVLNIAERHAKSGAGLASVDLAAALAAESADLESARALSARQLEIARSVRDVDAQLAALARLASLERRLATVERAEGGLGAETAARAHECAALGHLDEAEQIAASAGPGHRMADLLGERAWWLEVQGKWVEALLVCKRRAELYRQLGDLAGLQHTEAQRGRLLAALRRSSQALKALREAERLARRLHDPTALQSCLGDLADVLTARRRLDDALLAITERERLCRDVLGDPCAQALATLQRATLFGVAMKQPAVGLDLVKQAEEIAVPERCAEALARASAVRAAVLATGLVPQL
jgi:hypothetical protein